MGLLSYVAVGGSANWSALPRREPGVALNPILPLIPLVTLAANLGGGCRMGIALHWFATDAHALPRTQLALMTGCPGGLTTFSTLPAEVVALLVRKLYGGSLLLVGTHVPGSLLLTTVGLIRARFLLGGQT